MIKSAIVSHLVREHGAELEDNRVTVGAASILDNNKLWVRDAHLIPARKRSKTEKHKEKARKKERKKGKSKKVRN